MEKVEDFLQKLFPNLSDDVLKNTLEKFIDIGVSDLDDLTLLEEADLAGILKPIQIRKLQRCAKGLFQSIKM